MCRALRVLCAASDPDRLADLKRAAVDSHWEVVGGASGIEELAKEVQGWSPDVVVADASLGPEAAARIRASYPRARVVGVGRVLGADVEVRSLDEVKAAVLDLPPRAGPVIR